MTGQTTKYVKYALGEIVLVVIGILIALQINNWNEERKNNKSKLQLVNGLIAEFEANHKQLQTVIEVDSTNLKLCVGIQELMNSPAQSSEDSDIVELLTQIANYTFNPTNGVLKSGISSGHIHYIKNEALKEKLFAWDDIVKDAQEEEQLNRSDYFNRVNPFLENYIQTADILELYRNDIPKSKFKSRYNELLQDPQFENILVMRSVLILDALSELKPLRTQNIDIIHQLKEELNHD